ncbi:hypothetical protein EIN_057710 [Entamoeba invadens IP1]|uniref:hypothetical protein n=1 Tax=Entamoeba invadens IP1 TaxID=370355 RepID=UPI0002C3FA28|nr:hypothetical protein EIN_057710 [Entamoeba invadens IP1]ELP93366.1 hypothetical protein EIN_057710 [Entamoeba invadens IP1]|eukprot:XP_004260137.1 hypothetical protein EIN_057710 [Entamoeba invadens IP1]
MTVEIDNIPQVDTEEDLDHMVRPLQVWVKQMKKRQWLPQVAPSNVLEYCTLQGEGNEHTSRYQIYVKKPFDIVMKAYENTQLDKLLKPNLIENETLIKHGTNSLEREVQNLPWGSFSVAREFVFARVRFELDGEVYIVSSSVNSNKANTYKDQVVRAYKKLSVRVAKDKNDGTSIEVIIVVDLRGWSLGYVNDLFIQEQLTPFIQLKTQLEQ